MEKQLTINGVRGRYWYIKNPGVRAAGCHDAQKWVSESRSVKGYGESASMYVEIRFDDECGNRHNSFAITADVKSSRGRFIAGGCMHDEIAQVFPELAPLIQWHLCSTDGPMHYLANTLYLAGDRDCRGYAAGEPCAWEHVVYFGNSPVSHKLSAKFSAFLQSRMIADQDGGHYRDAGDFQVVAIAHADRPGETYKYGPKFTFAGFAEKWHECPFDDQTTADEWATALNSIRCEFNRIPTKYSEGKARELQAARSAAVWPEATDEQLSMPKAELQAALEARLPGLIARMRADIEAIGFVWQAADAI